MILRLKIIYIFQDNIPKIIELQEVIENLERKLLETEENFQIKSIEFF